MTSDQSIKRLEDGNKRYAAGTARSGVTDELRASLVKSQSPYAVIIGCSDSRVPVELIFDSDPGELFVIRTAGNVVGPLEIGSLEYAMLHLRSPLVVVLGHQHCGAVRAAVDGGSYTPALQAIVQEITPCVPREKAGNVYEICENENIKRTLAKIAADPIVSKAVSEGTLRLAAAKYSLETGLVSFFE
jgi:carbonic anhydrase